MPNGMEDTLDFLTGGPLFTPPFNPNTRVDTKGVEVRVNETSGIQKAAAFDVVQDLITVKDLPTNKNVRKVDNDQAFPVVTNRGAILGVTGIIGVAIIIAIVVRQ